MEPVTIRLAVTNATVAVDTTMESNAKMVWFRNIFTDINKCLSNACLNNGTCYNKPGSFKCKCTSGYDGENCANGEKHANNEKIECSNSSGMLLEMLNFFLLITQYIGLAQCSSDPGLGPCRYQYEYQQRDLVLGVTQPIRGDCKFSSWIHF